VRRDFAVRREFAVLRDDWERVVTPLPDGELLFNSVIVLSELGDAREPLAVAVGLATRLIFLFI